MKRRAFEKSIRILQAWKDSGIEPSQLVSFFSYLRQTMEANSIEKYPVLRTYSDWLLHSELSLRPHAHLLGRFTKYVDENYFRRTEEAPDVADNGWIKDLVEHALSPSILREEIVSLCSDFDFDLRSFSDDVFLGLLVTAACLEVVEKPIDLRAKLLNSAGHVDKNTAKKLLCLDTEYYAVAICLLVKDGHGSTRGRVLVAEVLLQSIHDERQMVFSLPLAAFS